MFLYDSLLLKYALVVEMGDIVSETIFHGIPDNTDIKNNI